MTNDRFVKISLPTFPLSVFPMKATPSIRQSFNVHARTYHLIMHLE